MVILINNKKVFIKKFFIFWFVFNGYKFMEKEKE